MTVKRRVHPAARCATCRFWNKAGRQEPAIYGHPKQLVAEDYVAECRRHAPRPDQERRGYHGWTNTAPGEWVCEVWQSAYGHAARKRTWLFYAGEAPPPRLNWARPAGSHQVGWFDRVKPTLGKRAASATPAAFRDELLSIARSARVTALEQPA